jgi:hypothetical protein
MSDQPTAPQGPGLRHQAGVRTGLRVVGATGPYCRACGTRNDAEARFCDSCGASMA